MEQWYQRSRRRYFLDFHIDGWNEEFLSRYDADQYAQYAKQGGGTAATFFANAHTGYTNYPTAAGTMHPCLKGRDILRETLDSLHRHGLDAVVYYCLGFVGDYWDKHPDARVTDGAGPAQKLRCSFLGARRHPPVCLNNPEYRHFAYAQIEEICSGYDFEGIWLDMTFLPAICHCECCRSLYRSQTGEEIPEFVNWKDAAFVRHIRARQRWLYQFNRDLTDFIRRIKPGISVVHQCQTFTWDWLAAASPELADCTDWVSADLYCDRYGLSYSGKLFYALSAIKPFERINCWNYPYIHEHVITRTDDEMRMIALSTVMNDGALVVIDQVDPSGALHGRNYEMMGRVFGEVERYEPWLGGSFRQDVGIYYSLNSNFDQADNGRPVADIGILCDNGGCRPPSENCHQQCADNAARTLVMKHVPYGVVSKRNLKELRSYKVLILPNVAMLDQEELDAIERYVREGGCLYASRDTSTISGEGVFNGEFLLAGLFGVRYGGVTDDVWTYVSPAEAGEALFPEVFSRDFPLTVPDAQVKVSVSDGDTTVLGTLTLPWECPEGRYASTLSDPPGRFTGSPALIAHKYGKGMAVYSGAALEIGTHTSQREVFYRVIRMMVPDKYCVETEGPGAVEVTRFDQTDQGRILLHVLNFQTELPNIPVHALLISVSLEGRGVLAIYSLPERKEIKFCVDEDRVNFRIDELKDYMLVCIEIGVT